MFVAVPVLLERGLLHSSKLKGYRLTLKMKVFIEVKSSVSCFVL